MEEYVWISKFAHHPLFQENVHPLLERLSQQYGVTVRPAGPFDNNGHEYVEAIRSATRRRVTGIMLVGWREEGVLEAVEQAVSKGVAVVTVGSDLAQSRRLAYVGSDWFRLGQDMAGEMAAGEIEPGRILVLGRSDLESVQSGYRGFLQQIAQYKHLEVIGPLDVGDSGPQRAHRTVREQLARYPDVRGIATIDWNAGPGAAEVLEDLGKAGEIRLICSDADLAHRAYLRRGTMRVAFAHRRQEFTALAFQMLYGYRHGASLPGPLGGAVHVPGNILTPHVRVTRGNVDSLAAQLNMDAWFRQYELTQQLDLISTMVQSSAEHAVATDSAGRILYANPATLRLANAPVEKVLGLAFDHIFRLSAAQKRDALHTVVERGEPYTCETHVHGPEGAAIPVQASFAPLRRDDSIRGMVVIALDITERKQAEADLARLNQELVRQREELRAVNQQLRAGEQQLRAANQQLNASNQQLEALNQQFQANERQLEAERDRAQAYLDTAAAIFLVLEPDGTATMVNRKGCEILGFEEEEILGRNWFELFVPEDERTRAFAGFRQYLAPDGPTGPFENAIQGRAGRRTIMWHTAQRFGEQGQIVGTLSCGLDVTEEREAETHYQSLFQWMLDAFITLETVWQDDKPVSFRFASCNEAAKRLFSRPEEKLLGRDIAEVLPGLDAFWMDLLARVARTGKAARFDRYLPMLNRHATGAVYRASRNQLAIVAMDITERKQAEQDLEAANQQLAAANQQLRAGEERLSRQNDFLEATLEAIDEPFFVIDTTTHQVLLANSAAAMNNDRRDLACHQVIHGSDRPCEKCGRGCPLETVRNTGRPSTALQAWTDGGGENRYWEIRGYPIRNEDNQVHQVIIYRRDVTERTLAEEALRRSEERFRLLYEQSPLAYQSLDEQGRLLEVNPAWRAAMGYRRDEVIGRWVGDFIVPEQRELFSQRFARFCTRGWTRGEQHELVRKDGTRFFVEFDGNIARDSAGRFQQTHCVIRDVTERIRTEEQIRRYQQRLRSLASELTLAEQRQRREIATGLHDQIGQSLALSQIKLGLLAQEVREPRHASQIGEVREFLEAAMARVRTLTFELSPPILYELGLRATLEWLVERARKDRGLSATFNGDPHEPDLDDDVRVVLFQAVRELLMNVIKHARANNVDVTMHQDARAVRIRVEDDGVGFDPEQLHGRSSDGFGLFNVRERVEYIGGHLKVVSQAGQGTRVSLVVPVHRESHQ